MSTTIHSSIYVLLGCPGSGKGSFAQSIQSSGYEYEHLSTGEILRDEVKRETEFGQQYKDAILNHLRDVIPFQRIQDLLEQRMEMAIAAQKGVILDGYPKSIVQCEHLERFVQKIQEKGLKTKIIVVLLDVNEQDAIIRISHRETCVKCSKLYNSTFSPAKEKGKCDICGGQLTKRIDDNPSNTEKRVVEFKRNMRPVIEYYATQNRLQLLNGNGKPEDCFQRFMEFHRFMHRKA